MNDNYESLKAEFFERAARLRAFFTKANVIHHKYNRLCWDCGRKVGEEDWMYTGTVMCESCRAMHYE